MRWPWQRLRSRDPLVLAWADQTLAWVHARRSADIFTVQQWGVQMQGSAALADFARQPELSALHGQTLHVMLRPSQYQILQIDAPAVPADELRAAVRWKIRDLVETHLDDLTIDVMRVGDEQVRGSGRVFVVVTRNSVVSQMLALAEALDATVAVIDIQDTAQRNLQNRIARQANRPDRANAALVLVDARQALLTISAREELFYTRRIDLAEGFLQSRWITTADGHEAVAAAPDPFAAVPEYVPGSSLGDPFSGGYHSAFGDSFSAGVPGTGGDERAQRFVVEVQRSLDLWDRTWSSIALDTLRVYAGERTGELAQWLTGELGMSVGSLELPEVFPGFAGGSATDAALCWPLLGSLLRDDGVA